METRVKKLIIGLALLAGCQKTVTTLPAPASRPGVTAGGAATGGTSPRAALDGFMAAVKAGDLQAMGTFWGTDQGPALTLMPQAEREERELIMVCYLKHDSYKVTDEQPGMDGKRVLSVTVTRKDLSRSTNFTMVAGPGARWYVLSMQMDPLRDLCAQR